MDVHAMLTTPKPSAVFDTYWRYAAERQAVYFCKLRGTPSPWTSDPIIAEHRFTNCYRAADRVSQYLLRYVVYGGDQDPKEVIFRTLLFKIFNKIETWEALSNDFAENGAFRIVANDLAGEADLPIAKVLDRLRAAKKPLYNSAYVMPSPGNAPVKHLAHLGLLDALLKSWENLTAARSLQALYEKLLAVKSFGRFLAFQFAIDLNYSAVFDFDEDEYVVAGPGALDGLAKCFTDPGGLGSEDLIRWVCDRQELEFDRRGLHFETLFGRRLKLIDCQNLFCEISKYTRVSHPDVKGTSGRTEIKQKYTPDARPADPPLFPPKWGLTPALDDEAVAQAVRVNF